MASIVCGAIVAISQSIDDVFPKGTCGFGGLMVWLAELEFCQFLRLDLFACTVVLSREGISWTDCGMLPSHEWPQQAWLVSTLLAVHISFGVRFLAKDVDSRSFDSRKGTAELQIAHKGR